jgi:hypothetical protein
VAFEVSHFKCSILIFTLAFLCLPDQKGGKHCGLAGNAEEMKNETKGNDVHSHLMRSQVLCALVARGMAVMMKWLAAACHWPSQNKMITLLVTL